MLRRAKADMMKSKTIEILHGLNRREALALLGGLGASAFVGGALTTAPAVAQSSVDCVLTPDLTEGPYFVDEKLNRSDIRTDPTTGAVRPGVPFTLTLNIYQVGSACGPLPGAYVDVWHADASGSYSDESALGTAGQKYLRGYQITDSNGTVRFTTIYPGWYMGRAVHIHFKVRTYSGTQLQRTFTSQFFFDDSITDSVYQQAPYSPRPNRDTRNSNDGIYAGAGSNVSRVLMTPTRVADGSYTGILNVGVDFSSSATTTTSMVLPQIAYGGGWQTSILLSNNNETSASIQSNFLSESGQSLGIAGGGQRPPGSGGPSGPPPGTGTPPGPGGSQPASLAARSTMLLDLPNTGNLVQGWAEFTLPSGVTGYGLYRWTAAGVLQEAVVPLIGESSGSGMFVFDDAQGLTAYALANPSTQATTITALVFAADGSSIGSASLPIEARSRLVGFFRSVPGLSGMAGARGIVRFSSSNGALCAIALRFGGNTFASIPIMYS